MKEWTYHFHREKVSLCISLLLMMVHVALCQTTTYNTPAGGYNGFTLILDSGGDTGKYGNNENKIYKFNCNTGRTVVLGFYSFTVLSGDILSIYDGAEGTTQTKVCGPCTSSQLKAGYPVGITGSSAVVTFTSDGSGVAAGYKFLYLC